MCENKNFKLLFLLIVFLNYISIINSDSQKLVSLMNCEFSSNHSEKCVETFEPSNKSQNFTEVKKSSKFMKNLNNYIKEKKDLFNVFENDYNSSDNKFGNEFKSLSQMFSNLDLKPIEMRLKKSIFDFIVSLNISDDCFQSLLRITDDFQEFRFWALECKNL